MMVKNYECECDYDYKNAANILCKWIRFMHNLELGRNEHTEEEWWYQSYNQRTINMDSR